MSNGLDRLRGLSAPWRLLILGMVVYFGYAALGLGLGLGRPGSLLDQLIADWLALALLAAGLGIAFRGALRAGPDRAAWLCITAAIALWTLGQLVFELAYGNAAEPPLPSISDALWLPAYPLYYAALVLLVRRRVRRFHRSWWLDGLIAALAISALAAALLFEPLRTLTGGSFASVATTLAYPVGDVVMLAAVAGVFAVTGWRAGRTWALLAFGIVLAAVGDSVYTLLAAAGISPENTPLDAVWVLSELTFALAAWQSRDQTVKLQMQGWRAIAVPLGFAALALAVLVSGLVHELNPLAYALALATLAGALLRTALTFRENLSLSDSRRLAVTDELTGLPNRRGFYARADAALAKARERGLPTALLLLDLDRFKELNDALGHHVGDEMLKQFSKRLLSAVPEAEVIGRLGGDEFVLLLEPGGGAAEALESAERLRVALEEPFALEDLLMHATASVGIAVGPEHGHERSDLLRRADVAMYRAKERGSGIELYDAADDPHSLDRLRLAGELRAAIGCGQLVLHYQPKLRITTGQVTGVEALVRWQHPQRGLLGPDEFVPLAERYGLARSLTLEVLDLALAQWRAWAATGLEVPVAVNLASANLHDARLPEDVRERLETWAVPGGALQLEITENTIMVDPVRALDVMARVSELGVRLSLDDFGTGYSSLAYLRRLPVSELKIDRSFVMSMTESADDAVIVRSTALLGRNLGLEVVAEGVETSEHWELLREYGCDIAQGYFMSRPVPATELARWIHDRSSAAFTPV